MYSSTDPTALAALESIGPYRIVGTLGAGGMSVVYRGEHRDTGEFVAIKTVIPRSEALLQSIRREIHALAQLRHSGIVRVLDHGVHEGLPWFAMDLVHGTSLRLLRQHIAVAQLAETASLVALTSTTDSIQPVVDSIGEHAKPGAAPMPTAPVPLSPADFPRVLAAFRALCEPLAFLHGEGMVHRDLKPDNVLIRTNGTPVLIDFGLATQFEGRLSLRLQQSTAGVQGTLLYMAPEVLAGEVADARADLYAFGCMLYEAIAGRPPFTGSVAQVTRGHAEQPPPPLRAVVPSIPDPLCALIDDLLAKEPRDRVGYADDVSARIAEAIISGSKAPTQYDTASPAAYSSTARGYLYRASLSGREQVLQTLARCVRPGACGLVLVAGESGVGKTRVLLELARQQDAAGACVVIGECTKEGRRTLEPLRPVLHAIADRCRAVGPASTRRILGGRAQILAAIEPELGELDGVQHEPPAPPLPINGAVRRLLRSLADTLAALADESPVLVVLDDVQWADELTLALLQLVAEHRMFEHVPVSIVAAYRAEETRPELAQLVATTGVESVALERLDARAVAAIIGDMLAMRPPPAELAAHLASSSEGNPFFVTEYLRTAVELSLLVHRRNGWQLSEGRTQSFAPLPLPASLRALVGQRIAGLDQHASTLLEAAAVLGRETEVRLAMAVARLSEPAAFRGVTELVRRQVLEEPRPGVLRFCHDKLREVVEERLDPARRRALHRDAAMAYEADLNPSCNAHADRDREALSGLLARHYTLADMPAPAARHERLAGQVRLRTLAFAESIAHFEHAIALIDALPDDAGVLATRAGLRLELYAAIMQAHSAADDRLVRLGEQALAIAEVIGEPQLVARIHSALGGTLMTRGEYSRAIMHCQRARRAVASEPLEAVYAAMVLGTCSTQLGELDFDDIHVQLIEHIERTARTTAMFGAPYPPYVTLCGSVAIVAALRGELTARDAYIAKMTAAATEARHRYGMAFAHINAALAFEIGDGERCAQHGDEAVRIATESGMSGPRMLGMYCAGVGRALAGHTREAISYLQDALAQAARLGYSSYRTEAYYGLALARLHDGDHANCIQACEFGLELAGVMGERKLASELHRLLGEAWLATEGPSERAENYLQRSFVEAEARGMRVFATYAQASINRLRNCR